MTQELSLEQLRTCQKFIVRPLVCRREYHGSQVGITYSQDIYGHVESVLERPQNIYLAE